MGFSNHSRNNNSRWGFGTMLYIPVPVCHTLHNLGFRSARFGAGISRNIVRLCCSHVGSSFPVADRAGQPDLDSGGFLC